MKPKLRRLLSFTLWLVPLLVVFFALYVGVLHRVYPPTVHAAANLVTERLSPPSLMVLGPSGWSAYSIKPDGARRWLKSWEDLDWIYINLVLLPALLLATPTTWPTRLRLLGMGIVLLFLVHVLSVIGLSRGYVCSDRTRGGFVCMCVLRIAYTSGQYSTMVLWIPLTWRHWFRKPERPAPA
jgi:hypothetical protein